MSRRERRLHVLGLMSQLTKLRTEETDHGVKPNRAAKRKMAQLARRLGYRG